MAKKRIEWIDIAKYVGIILVMVSHLESDTEVLATFYRPFYLTLFFFTSGYVYNARDNFKTFFYKKFRQLFVPWLIFSVFIILLSQVLSFNEQGRLLTELKWNFLQIRGIGDEIWFVAALFVAFIPFYFLIDWSNKAPSAIKGGSKVSIAIVISFVLSLVSIVYTKLMNPELLPWNSVALPWHLEYIFQAMFFMVLGYFFKTKGEVIFDKYNTTRNRIICWGIYLVLIYMPFATGFGLPGYIDVIYQYVCQLTGIAAVVSVCKIIKTNKYISYVGQNTLIYFALHGKVYSLGQTILKKFAGEIYSMILSNVVISSLFAILFSLVLSVVLIIPAYVINRWFPAIVGRKKVHKERRTP